MRQKQRQKVKFKFFSIDSLLKITYNLQLELRDQYKDLARKAMSRETESNRVIHQKIKSLNNRKVDSLTSDR